MAIELKTILSDAELGAAIAALVSQFPWETTPVPVVKDARMGNRTETMIPLDSLGLPNTVLQLVTMKRSNRTVSFTAKTAALENGFIVYAMFQDYNEVLLSEAKPATHRVVSEMHQEGLSLLPSILQKVVTFYKTKKPQ